MTKNNHFSIPDLCKPQTLFYILLLSELSIMVWELADGGFQWKTLGLKNLSILWIVLTSVAVLCRVRPYLDRFSVGHGWLICFSVIVIMGVLVIGIGQFLLSPIDIHPRGLFQQSLALALISAMVLRLFQLQQQVIEQSQAELSSQMEALQARIKPHFLFNSLNTIAELIATQPEEAEKAVENLSTLFRANLKQATGTCSLADELTLVKGYLELEQWRLGKRLNLIWNESIADDKWFVPILSLQPLVENAVLHGVAASESGGDVRISVLQTPKIITFTIENTLRVGSQAHSGHGIGTENIKRRLQVLYGDLARYRVESTSKHYKVTVTIPKSREHVS